MTIEKVDNGNAEQTDTIKRMDRVLSAGGLNNLSPAMSGSRLRMGKIQQGQAIPIINSDTKQLMAGVEVDYARATWGVSADCNMRVLKVIPKYRGSTDSIYTNPTDYIVYEDVDTLEIGVMTVPSHMSHHTTFGFSLIKTDTGRSIKEDDYIAKDTPIAHGPGRKANDDFGFGKEANYAYFGTFDTNEDGAGVNTEVKEMYQSEVFTNTEIYLDSNFTLANLFGDDEYYKPLPSLGETIPGYGLLATKRELKKVFSPINLNKTNLGRSIIPFDTEYFNPLKSTVVDITVIKGNTANTNNLPKGLVKYLDNIAVNHQALYDTVVELDNNFARRYGSRNYNKHPSWHILLTEAYRSKPHLPNIRPMPTTVVNNTMVTGYYIKVTTKAINTPQLGHKFTGMHGEKFVICNFKPPEDCPTDKWGRRAHFWTNPSGVSNRTNPSQLFEQFKTDACFHTRLKMLDMKESGKTKEELREFLFGFYKLISKDTYELVTEYANAEEQLAHVDEVMATRIRLEDEIGHEHLGVQFVGALRDTPYYPPRDKITFRTNGGKIEESLSKVRISNKYIFALDKIGAYTSACSVPVRQHQGFAAKLASAAKKYSQISTQGSRLIGETESRALFSYTDPVTTCNLLNLNSNPLAMKEVVEQQVEVGGMVSVRDLGSYNSRGSGAVNHLFKSFGYGFTNTKDDEK